MKGKIDLQKNGIILSGQPLLLSTPISSSTPTNPLACCVPISTSTSIFTNSIHNTNFLPFMNILWVEETSSSKPNEIEVTYVYPINHSITNSKKNGEFELPYEDAKKKLYPTTQILTIESTNLNPLVDNYNGKLSDYIMRLSYPFYNYSKSLSFKPRSIFVLINPHSGKGNAIEIFNKHVKPILTSAHCKLTIQHTEYKGHGTELSKSLNIDDYDTILCASGDGIPYEVINGFYQREDRSRAFSKINIVQTPGGSGNAMSLSCLGATSASLAAVRILKGKESQCDLMAISKESSNEVILSFLSQTYGAIAQADIGTEWMRSIGDIRFDIGVAYEVFSGHKYPCDIAVKWKCKDNDEIHKHYKNEKHNKNQNSNNFIKDQTFVHMNKLSNTSEETTDNSIIIRNDNNNNNNDNFELKELKDEDFELKYHDNFKNSTSYFDSLPEGWSIYDKNITNNSRIFYAGKMPYIASTTNFFPAALPTDGTIDVVVFDSRSNFISTANALLSLDKGTHVWEECVEHSKVEAFRLIPKAKDECFISVDGEWFPYEPFQVEVLNKIMRTILWSDCSFTESGYLANAI
jgi:sphingosine kinase